MWKRAIVLGVGLLATVPARAQTVEVRPFAASDGEEHDDFGFALTFEGERMLIGAWADGDQGPASGSTYVFERDGSGSWTQVAKLLASDGEELYYFGIAVALQGDLALIGANRDDDPVDFSGSVYVFERSPAGIWLETGKFASGRPGEAFGTSIVLQGDRAFVGAPGRLDLAGHVFVYERDATGQWNQAAMLSASDGHALDFFGWSLAAAGDRLLVGAYLHGQDGDHGAVYVFERDAAGAWIERTRFSTAALEMFGVSIDLEGERALIGAQYGDGAAWDAGAAYVFEREPGGTWVQRARLTASDGAFNDHFGATVALEGERALIGAPGDNEGPMFGPGHNSGSAYLFERGSDGTWRQVGRFLGSGSAFEDNFGSALFLRGDQALIGAVNDDGAATDSGAAYLFDLEPLSADVPEVSVSRGGTQTLELDAGHAFAGRAYRVLGSLSGTEPGIALPRGFLLPLNPDPYFQHTLASPDKPPLFDGAGALDANGHARASFVLPAGMPISLVGRTAHHAFVVLGAGERGARFVSNSRALRFVP